MGKVAHCLPVVARPRLPGSTAAIPDTQAQVQLAVNNVARSVVGCRREDHITIRDLLEVAKYLSLNQQVVKATDMFAWTAFHSSHGSNGSRNPVGKAMFSNAELPKASALRSTTAGEVRVRTRGLVKGRGMSCGHRICSGITAVRGSQLGRLEVATTHRDGDKPEKIFPASFQGVQGNDKWPHSQTARKGRHLGGEECQDQGQGQVQGQGQGQGWQGHPSSPRPRIDPPSSTFFS
jgi:hypothetical protein